MNQIEKIENTYDLSQIYYGDIQVWPILRIYFHFLIREKLTSDFNQKTTQLNWIQKFKRITQITFGISNILKQSDILVFSNSTGNRLIESKYKNYLFIEIFESLKTKKILYFERPVGKHFPIKKQTNPNPISTSIIDSISFIISFFLIKKRFSNQKILKEIMALHNINIPIERLLVLFIAYRLVFKIILKWKKPKVVFISDYYNIIHQSLVTACNELHIPLIEQQHGVINREHPAYNLYSNGFDKKYFPKYLFCFGESVPVEISKTSFFDPKHIYVTGHPYINYLLRNKRLSRIKNKSFIHIIVSLQDIGLKRLINFIIEANISNFKYKFILIPRHIKSLKNLNIKLPKNMVFELEKSIYDCFFIADIHITFYSTTALEAPTFGVPNVLVNFDNKAIEYYASMLNDKNVTRFINNSSELLPAIEDLRKTRTKQIKKSNQKNIYYSNQSKTKECLKSNFYL